MKLIHGSKKPLHVHVGLCLTDDLGAAMEYSRMRGGGIGYLTQVDLPHGLKVGKVDVGFDESGAPGDTRKECDEYADDGFDVIKYRDESYNGVEHWTWRLVSPKAVEALRILEVVPPGALTVSARAKLK